MIVSDLERLEIAWTTSIDRKMDDTIFCEFEFPKLCYLRCSTPEVRKKKTCYWCISD